MYKFILIFCFSINCCFAQSTLGRPDIINFEKQEYQAGLQNWDIVQDKNDIIYVANNEGMLSYNGEIWQKFPLPNKTVVRALCVSGDNRIYVGGQDEMGFFDAQGNGSLQYHSISNKVSEADRSFGDVWDIFSYNGSIFFRTDAKIFRWQNDQFIIYNSATEWQYLGICNDTLYAQAKKMGLFRWQGQNWVSVEGDKMTTDVNNPITAIIPMGQKKSLIVTLKGKFYNMDQGILKESNYAKGTMLHKERIFHATRFNDSLTALATTGNGIFIMNNAGEVIQNISSVEGMQNDNVLKVFVDRKYNIWLGLDNGIDFIAYNSPIKFINPLKQNNPGYCSIVYNGNLYVGTSTGLYEARLQQQTNVSLNSGKFSLVESTKGQAWSLSAVNNTLLLGHHEGVFKIADGKGTQIGRDNGYWNFSPASNIVPTDHIVAGTYNGLQVLNFKNGNFEPGYDIQDFSESSRFVAIDKFENIWVSQPYHGIFKISAGADGKRGVEKYSVSKGLPSVLNNYVYKVKNQIVAATENGVYEYNYAKDSFEPSAFYQKIFGRSSVRYLNETTSGNVCFVQEKTPGIIDFFDKKNPKAYYFSSLKGKILGGFENIYALNDSNIFISAEKGIYHVNYQKYRQDTGKLSVQVRSVSVTFQNDSLIFGGYFGGINERTAQRQRVRIAPESKAITFRFSSILYGQQSHLEYSYRLIGFDKSWSEWSNRTSKEYTNLSHGKYSFEVKVRSDHDTESDVSSFAFAIVPFWYQSSFAKGIFLLLFLALNYLFYKWLKKKFAKQRQRFEQQQERQKYIHELETNKAKNEIIALQNQKLESDLNFKNAELASSAMHLVKKGELLSKLKMQLSQISSEIKNPQAVDVIRKLIKKVGEDDKMDEDWDHFAKHFDNVHSDFLASLKEMHPTLSGNELKLCANLRMNLSSKEIAQLMNISLRGVEIGRYRLRKKLGITTEINLFDYLIAI